MIRRGRCSSRRADAFTPTKVLAVNAAEALPAALDLAGYRQALIVVKAHGAPVGCLRLACPDGRIALETLREAIAADPEINRRLRRAILMRWLMQRQPEADMRRLSWSVIICTRDRTEALAKCLDAVVAARVGEGEILVVDNDPSDELTRQLAVRYPVRYIREPRRGLNWARAAGAAAARGEILLYTDDDVVVDSGWISGVLSAFVSPRVGAVTGLTLPYELETPAQELFEFYGGHRRGFERRVFDDTVIPAPAAGLVGNGANMAIRRDLALTLGLFDCEMDVGTVTRSGGDTYAFYRLLAGGYRIVYTPEALVWHRHRRDDAALRTMLYGYSVGVFTFLARVLLQHRDLQALDVGMAWFLKQHVKQALLALLRRPDALPGDLVAAEWRGAFAAPWAYLASMRQEAS